MDLSKLREPLSIHEVDFRVKSVFNGWLLVLAYKDARVDINRLDSVCGPLNWKREHTRDNKNCIVSIWCSEKKQWVSKEDTGVESNTEAEKGLASDSFKRACFNFGIGIELYDYPKILIKLEPNEFYEKNGKYFLDKKTRFETWKWHSEFKDGKLIRLACKDNNSRIRFDHKIGER